MPVCARWERARTKRSPCGSWELMVTEPTYNPDSPGEPNVGRRLLDAALSLKCKATGLVVVLTLAVSASVSGYLLQSSGELARDEHDIQMVHMASVLAKAAAATMITGDLEGLQALAAESANSLPASARIILFRLTTQSRQSVITRASSPASI